MIIVCSSINCALACGGNEARETWRWQVFACCEVGWSPTDNEDVSPNKVNSFRPRYTKVLVAILPKVVKPVIGMEVTSVCTCRAGRGDWRERASKEQFLYLGDPSRDSESEVDDLYESQGNHNLSNLRRRKSAGPVVVMTPGNAGRAKRPYRYHVNRVEGSAA